MRVVLVLAISRLAALPARADCVILLHGLARSATSLWMIEEVLEAEGYAVVNQDYPSTEAPIAELATAIDTALSRCGPGEPVHVVTHSMGGILLRVWMVENDLPRFGRAVMLAPPNQGAELADRLGEIALFERQFGPAGQELGTDEEDIPPRLPPVDFELGVIAGYGSINPVASALIEGQDDGTVALDSTPVEGMADFIALRVSHTFMMNNPLVVAQVLEFIETGGFDPEMDIVEAMRRVLP